MQRALFQWITLATPRIPQLKRAFHPANGGKRNKIEAARLKGLGVRKGVLDVYIPARHPLGCFTGLALELKVKPNKPTPEQLDEIEGLIIEGWRAEIVWSFDEARAMIAGYFNTKP